MILEERKRRKRYIFMTCTIRFSKENCMQGKRKEEFQGIADVSASSFEEADVNCCSQLNLNFEKMTNLS
jgi:hypothetical protein